VLKAKKRLNSIRSLREEVALMFSSTGSRPISLVRGFVETIPEDGLGADQTWTWTPVVPVNKEELIHTSPTNEYCSDEGDE